MKRFSKLKPDFNFLIILFYSVISRFYSISFVPQLLNTDILSRYISTALNIGSLILIYFLIRQSNKSRKIALLSSWVFMLLPWVIEQGRITSQVNNYLFFILLTILMMMKNKNLLIRILLMLVLPVSAYFIYPDFWIFKSFQIPTFASFLNNIFFLISPEFIFFRNITNWWGGVKEFGILYLSFLPFFVIGLFKSVQLMNIKIWIGLLLLIIITSLSPYFPETRELFLAIPIISIIISYGIYRFYQMKARRNLMFRIFQIVIFFLVIYDLMQFNHFYYVHYPQNINSNIINIHEPF